MLPNDRHFPRYTLFDPDVPVWCLTPGRGGAIHRFFDTSPLSPSGRYLAVFRLPQERELPQPGERGEVCLVDLATGEDRTLATTAGWEPQMGANLNWGRGDETLFFNDLDTNTWQPFAWRVNPQTGEKQRIGNGVYQASPDGQFLATMNLVTMRRTQFGYGVVVPDDRVPRNVGLRDDDGLFLTDVRTGLATLMLSLRQFVEAGGEQMGIDKPDDWEVYGFHVKWSPDGQWMGSTLRWFPNLDKPRWNLNASGTSSGLHYAVFTHRPDGRDLRLAVGPDQWDWGGHHYNFLPDGTGLSMNLALNAGAMRFCTCSRDGSNLRPMLDSVEGSGHPTVHPTARSILTDAYAHEPEIYRDGTVPLRWVGLEDGSDRHVVRIHVETPADNVALRVDPHPAWDRSWTRAVFNGFVDGSRRIFLADMNPLL